MKTSTKGRTRGGGRGVRPGRGDGPGAAGSQECADRVRGQLTRAIAGLGNEALTRLVAEVVDPAIVGDERLAGLVAEAERRAEEAFPFRFHERSWGGGFERHRPGEKPERDDYDLLAWVEAPSAWWKMVREALNGGMRVSIAVPPAYAVDVAVIATRGIIEIPLRAAYDAVAERIILIHDDEEAIREKLAEQEQ